MASWIRVPFDNSYVSLLQVSHAYLHQDPDTLEWTIRVNTASGEALTVTNPFAVQADAQATLDAAVAATGGVL